MTEDFLWKFLSFYYFGRFLISYRFSLFSFGCFYVLVMSWFIEKISLEPKMSEYPLDLFVPHTWHLQEFECNVCGNRSTRYTDCRTYGRTVIRCLACNRERTHSLINQRPRRRKLPWTSTKYAFNTVILMAVIGAVDYLLKPILKNRLSTSQLQTCTL